MDLVEGQGSVVIQGLQRKDAFVPDAGYISCTRCDNISQRIVEGGITETEMVLVLSRRFKKLDELTVAVMALIGYQIPDHSKRQGASVSCPAVGAEGSQ